MKKVLMFLMLVMGLAIAPFGMNAAEGDLVDLFPYDQEACLLAENSCTQLKLGDSFWDLEFGGHRYHFVRGGVRYAKDFNDANSDGFISATEMNSLQYNAFASMIINDTDSPVILSTANGRADLTSVVQRIWTYFDASGKLQMVEDQIFTYYIFNDGTPEAPDWRLATAEEKTAYDAADPKPATTRVSHVRMKIDATDAQGYVLEPVKYIAWTNADVDTTTELDKEKWSTIIVGDPNFVTIPAGWTTVSFGTNDRGSLNAKTTDFIKTLPGLLANAATANAEIVYTHQAPTFAGITALDDDNTTAGVNIVVDYQSAFDLPLTVEASWVNMFDAQDKIQNLTEKLDYQVEIWNETGETLLQTIDFTWDEVNSVYTKSAAVTAVDSSVFGAGYKAKFIAETTLGGETVVEADIVVGVMPPKFAGVVNRFSDEGQYVNVMQGITADDGYGNDITNTIQVTYPAGFNFYAPKAGVYQINLQFTHHVHIPGVPDQPATVTFKGSTYNVTKTNVQLTSIANDISVWTDVTTFKTSTFSWGSAGVIIEVAGDGTVIRTINRRTWDLVDVNGTNTPANASGMFDAWLAGLTLEENGYIVVIGVNKATEYALARTIVYDDPVSKTEFVAGIPDFDTDIVKTASYTLTIDDKTAPELVVVNENFKFEAGDFTSANEAILSNVIAIDNHDARADVVIYVSQNGGLNVNNPGTYSVEVVAEDQAGNASTVTFNVVVVAKPVTPEIVDEQIDEKLDDKEQEIIDYITENTLTLEQIQDLIEGKEDQVGTSMAATIAISLSSSVVAFAAAFIILRKRP